ncbi:MAG: hypothetical protein ABSF95_15050 [Verrucomicrobiota bacterium]
MTEQRPGFAGEVNKDCLGDVLGEFRIAANLAEGRGIDDGQVPADEFGKGLLGPAFGILTQEFSSKAL